MWRERGRKEKKHRLEINHTLGTCLPSTSPPKSCQARHASLSISSLPPTAWRAPRTPPPMHYIFIYIRTHCKGLRKTKRSASSGNCKAEMLIWVRYCIGEGDKFNPLLSNKYCGGRPPPLPSPTSCWHPPHGPPWVAFGRWYLELVETIPGGNFTISCV